MHRRLLAGLLLGCGLLVGTQSFAHDDPEPRHGGIVRTVNDVSYEFVARDDSVTIHVTDHGKPVSTQGMTGRITILSGNRKSDAALVATGDRLEAKGVKIAEGARVVAALTMADRKAVTVRFTIK